MIGPGKTSGLHDMIDGRQTIKEEPYLGMNPTNGDSHEGILYRIKDNAVRNEDGMDLFQMDEPFFSRRSGQTIF